MKTLKMLFAFLTMVLLGGCAELDAPPPPPPVITQEVKTIQPASPEQTQTVDPMSQVQIFHSDGAHTPTITIFPMKEGWIMEMYNHAGYPSATRTMTYIPDAKHEIDWKVQSKVFFDALAR